jgi:hypothetical protein
MTVALIAPRTIVTIFAQIALPEILRQRTGVSGGMTGPMTDRMIVRQTP